MNIWLVLLVSYVVGFAIFYFIELQDSERASTVILKVISDETPQEDDKQQVKQIYALVSFVSSVLWPIWVIRKILGISDPDNVNS